MRRPPGSPTRPWRTIWGIDGCWSGSILTLTGRNDMALSYTFMESSKKHRSREAFWFTVAVAETRRFKKLRGGWSEACRVILETFPLDPLSGLAGMTCSCRSKISMPCCMR